MNLAEVERNVEKGTSAYGDEVPQGDFQEEAQQATEDVIEQLPEETPAAVVHTNVPAYTADAFEFAGNTWAYQNRDRLKENPALYADSQWDPFIVTANAAIPYLEKVIETEPDNEAAHGQLKSIKDALKKVDRMTMTRMADAETEKDWFDEMYEPFEGGFRLRDRGEGGAIPVKGAAEWLQRQAEKVIEMPQMVTTEQAAEMKGGATAAAGPVVWSGPDANKVYGKEEEGYLPPAEAGFNSLNMRPLPAGDKRGHLNWDGRVKADSPLGISLMEKFGKEKPLRDAKGNPTGNRYVKITDGNYVTLVALGGEYLLFDTKSHGTQAGLENLLSKVVWNGQTRPDQFIPGWLGANKDTGQESEGGKEVEKAYIGSVEDTLKGFDLGEELDPKSLDHLFAAWVSMATHEASTANAATTEGVDLFLSAVMEDGFEFRLPGRKKMKRGDLPKEWNPTEWRKTVTSVTNQDGSVSVTMGGNTVTFSKTGVPSVAGN